MEVVEVISPLPSEIVLEIFANLNAEELMNARFVCKTWNSFIKKPKLISKIYRWNKKRFEVHDYIFKIQLLGDYGVGKSSLVYSFAYGPEFRDFIQFHAGIGIDFGSKTFEIDDLRYRIQLFDTAGAERFRNLPKRVVSNKHGYLMVFDVENRFSLESLRNLWLNYGDIGAPKMIIGNKCDSLNRQVSEEEGKQFADSFGLPYMETTTIGSRSIEKVVIEMIKGMKVRADQMKQIPKPVETKVKSLDPPMNKTNSFCSMM